MANPFENRATALSDPARDLVPVAPDDSNDLPKIALALYVETGGAISLTTVAGHSRSVNVGDFSILPVGVSRVMSTGTTASGIHALTVA